ncbi:MAG: tRNA-dihydrouridine synthase family protein [Treponema sp.]|nr:tRNA-dihydrouridine synthase family protein [Treponema sp.]
MKLIFGPMATLSHQGMRRTLSKFGGVDEYYTEMIHTSSLVAGGQYEPYYILNETENEKIVWQLTGNKLDDFAEAAKIVCQKGGIGIDINMGCSAPDIVRSGAGIAWMKKPLSETAKILESVRGVLNENKINNCKRLSVKFRLGAEDWTEKKFYNFIDMLVSEGVSQFVLHPRTQKEKLCRPIRLHYCEELAKYILEKYGTYAKDANAFQIILNGNIKDVESAMAAQKKCPSCHGIMIARGAVQKPWVFSQIKNKMNSEYYFEQTDIISKKEIDLLNVAKVFIEDLKECQPKDFWKSRAHRFFVYYCNNFMFASQVRCNILNCVNLEDMILQLENYFEKMPEERFLK